MCTSILNPWTSVNFSQTIAPVDVSTIYSLSPKALSKIELRTLPEPFHEHFHSCLETHLVYGSLGRNRQRKQNPGYRGMDSRTIYEIPQQHPGQDIRKYVPDTQPPYYDQSHNDQSRIGQQFQKRIYPNT